MKNTLSTRNVHKIRKTLICSFVAILGLWWFFFFTSYFRECWKRYSNTPVEDSFELSDDKDRGILQLLDNRDPTQSGNQVKIATEKPAAPEVKGGVVRVVTNKKNDVEMDPKIQSYFDPTKLVNAVLWDKKYSDVSKGECQKKDGDSTMLDKIVIWGGSTRKQPRIFCGIYTHQKNHQTKVKAVKETWASRCDGFVAFSDVSDNSIPTFGIEHEGQEAWENMWQKTRSIWKYIYHWYRTEYDWFLLGGDDMFIIVENLRKYLSSKELNKGDNAPYYLGMRFKPQDGRLFQSGGASYVLNVAALDAAMKIFDTPACFPNLVTFAEDVMMARCLSEAGIPPYDTKDELGEERFHPFTPNHHLTYRIPKEKEKDWYANYALDLKEGPECCSKDSISWHYIDPTLMHRIFNLLYTCKMS